MLDVDALRRRFLGAEFDVMELVLDPDKLAAVARAVGERRPEYLDPTRSDFRATPAYVGSLSARRHLPVDFPDLGGLPMDGGKAIECLAPVEPNVVLTCRSHLHEIYEKSGRSGRMVFIVSRMELYDPAGTHVATNDSRIVIRERPPA